MGATRESNWSGGILADGVCEVDVGMAVCCGGGMYANVSPGRMPTMQMITSRDWKAVPCRFGCMGTSPLSVFLSSANVSAIKLATAGKRYRWTSEVPQALVGSLQTHPFCFADHCQWR